MRVVCSLARASARRGDQRLRVVRPRHHRQDRMRLDRLLPHHRRRDRSCVLHLWHHDGRCRLQGRRGLRHPRPRPNPLVRICRVLPPVDPGPHRLARLVCRHRHRCANLPFSKPVRMDRHAGPRRRLHRLCVRERAWAFQVRKRGPAPSMMILPVACGRNGRRQSVSPPSALGAEVCPNRTRPLPEGKGRARPLHRMRRRNMNDRLRALRLDPESEQADPRVERCRGPVFRSLPRTRAIRPLVLACVDPCGMTRQQRDVPFRFPLPTWSRSITVMLLGEARYCPHPCVLRRHLPKRLHSDHRR